jgi:D-alanine-D-alanine ligase
MADLPFVGSGVLGSAVCMDKDVTKRLLRDAGLPVTPFLTFNRLTAARTSFEAVVSTLGAPVFVKPANQGSSVGVSKAETEAEFQEAMTQAFAYDTKVLVEQAVNGREIECAILGNDEPVASACGEIVVHDGFYSYDTKYIDDAGALVKVPADLPLEVSERIQALALDAFKVLGCAGLARVDVFLTTSGDVLINEVNTLPGCTNISMYPKLWEASGLSYRDLISRLIELAQERHVQEQALKTSR